MANSEPLSREEVEALGERSRRYASICLWGGIGVVLFATFGVPVSQTVFSAVAAAVLVVLAFFAARALKLHIRYTKAVEQREQTLTGRFKS